MFMLSSVRVQMMTLCSELVSRAVYRNPPRSPSPLEGCFKEKRRLMFHRPARLSVFSDAATVTTMYELNWSYSSGVEIIHLQWECYRMILFYCLMSLLSNKVYTVGVQLTLLQFCHYSVTHKHDIHAYIVKIVGKKMNIVCFYLSTNIPACTACTMLRNFGFSSERRTGRRTLWVKVDANQSVTSEGTPSDCSCWRSSSDSRHCLGEATKHIVRQC